MFQTPLEGKEESHGGRLISTRVKVAGSERMMKNSPGLPVFALLLAIALTALVLISAGTHPGAPLSELELGGVGVAIALYVFAAQAFISITLEGEELHLGKRSSVLTNQLTAGIVILALLLLATAFWLGLGIVSGWGTTQIGIIAAAGCLVIALLLLLYKEAFLGDEARLDERDDGVPW